MTSRRPWPDQAYELVELQDPQDTDRRTRATTSAVSMHGTATPGEAVP